MADTDAAILATAKAMFEWRRKHQFCAACGQPSETKDGGWKRHCPSCQVEHFPRTDPVVIMLACHGDRCMMGRKDCRSCCLLLLISQARKRLLSGS
jgi:NAD+ diphosphatase